jgi:hypothetical protein
MKHVAVPLSYSVHIFTLIRGRNGRRGVSPVSSPAAHPPVDLTPYALLPRGFTSCGCPHEGRGHTALRKSAAMPFSYADDQFAQGRAAATPKRLLVDNPHRSLPAHTHGGVGCFQVRQQGDRRVSGTRLPPPRRRPPGAVGSGLSCRRHPGAARRLGPASPPTLSRRSLGQSASSGQPLLSVPRSFSTRVRLRASLLALHGEFVASRLFTQPPLRRRENRPRCVSRLSAGFVGKPR